jgi:hypothetical protein
MNGRRWSRFVAAVALVPGPAALPAEPPSPPARCASGYVWREAFPGDVVCVTPETRAQAARDNAEAEARKQPGGGEYGPNTCRSGYVWREARPEDLVCVTPEVRTQAAEDNRAAPARLAAAPPPATESGPQMQGAAAAAVTRAGGPANAAGTLAPPREQTLPAENVRCRAYAQRAVDQYRLSTRTAKCRIASDGRWHARTRDHYQWCTTAAAHVVGAEEKARDAHLYRCGGQTRID